MLKANLSKLKNVKLIDLNHIEAETSNGQFKVEIRRFLKGWDAQLEIKIDGTVWHNTDAGHSDRVWFEKLTENAYSENTRRLEKRREEAREIAKQVFELVK